MNSLQINRLLLYAALSALGFASIHASFFGYLTIQLLLFGFFMIGMVFEFAVAKHRFFVLPPALFSVYCFIGNMLFGVVYFAFNLKETSQFVVADYSAVRGTWYTLVAVQTLWISFYSIPDRRIRFFSDVVIKKIPSRFIYVLIGISLSAFVLGIKLGVYGYVADHSNTSYVSYIGYAVNLGLLAIILLTVYEYDDLRKRVFLYSLVGVYFIVGIAFGSKSTAVIPMVLLIVSLYFTNRKIQKAHLLIAVLLLSLAYAIVEPFRYYYGLSGKDYNTTSIYELGQLYSDAQAYSDEDSDREYLMSFLRRNNYVVPLAKTLEFADRTNYYHTEEWGNVLLAPVYAIVPRFLWQSKPVSNFGVWSSVNIFDLPETTNTGITTQGYSYLVFRFVGIVLVFLFSGIIQRVMFNILYLNRALVPFYILLYFSIGYPSEAPWTFLAGSIQSLIFMLPLILLLVYLNRGEVSAGETLGQGRVI